MPYSCTAGQWHKWCGAQPHAPAALQTVPQDKTGLFWGVCSAHNFGTNRLHNTDLHRLGPITQVRSLMASTRNHHSAACRGVAHP